MSKKKTVKQIERQLKGNDVYVVMEKRMEKCKRIYRVFILIVGNLECQISQNHKIESMCSTNDGLKVGHKVKNIGLKIKKKKSCLAVT